MKTFRLGVVGLGHRGRSMFRWMSENIEDIQAAAACDLKSDLWFKDTTGAGGDNKSMAELMPDVKFFESFEEMLEKANLDILLVETPATNHATFCAKALQAGVNVYSDIPTVRTLAEADMLWKVEQSSSSMFMTGATTCGWGFVLTMQDLYRQGMLGRPFALEAEYIHDCRYLWAETPWRKPSVKDGSMPIRYCTHSLGPLLSIMDEELRSVYCVSTGSNVTDNEFAHDYMSALFQTPSGVSLRMTCSFINNAGCGNHSYRVFGTEGYFEHLSARGAGHPARTMYNSTKLAEPKTLTDVSADFSPYTSERGKKYDMGTGAVGHGGADLYLMQLFAEALRTGAKVAPISLKQGLAMTIPGLYAAESVIRGGKPLAIHYPWDADFQADVAEMIH